MKTKNMIRIANIFAYLWLLAGLPGAGVQAWGQTSPDSYFREGLFNYRITGNNTVEVNNVQDHSLPKYEIPPTVAHEGVEYTVTSTANVFFDCPQLIAVELPSTLLTIGNGTFADCTGLQSIRIPQRVTAILSGAFSNCTSLTRLELPAGLKEIGQSVYWGCTSLRDITLPQQIEKIGPSAFHGCTALSQVTIPGSVREIGDFAFGECTGLVRVEICPGTQQIGTGVFYNCPALSNVILPSSVTTIGKMAFQGCSALATICLPEKLETIEKQLFMDCSNLQTVIWPPSLKTIGKIAFGRCVKLKSATLPENLQIIESQAFIHCSNLESIIFPSRLQRIGEKAFTNCTSLRSIDLPPTITTLPYGVFGFCDKLQAVKLPYTMSSLAANALADCPALQEIHVASAQPPAAPEATFLHIDTTSCIVFVPKGCVDTYRKAETWKNFRYIYEEGTEYCSIYYELDNLTAPFAPTRVKKGEAARIRLTTDPHHVLPQAVRLYCDDKELSLSIDYIYSIKVGKNDTATIAIPRVNGDIRVVAAAKGGSAVSFFIRYELEHLTAPSAPVQLPGGSPLGCTLKPDHGYLLPDTLSIQMKGYPLMAGRDYSYDPQTGKISLRAVTGPVCIAASGRDARKLPLVPAHENIYLTIHSDSTYDADGQSGYFNGTIGTDDEICFVRGLFIAPAGKLTLTLKNLWIEETLHSSALATTQIAADTDIELVLQGENQLGRVKNEGTIVLHAGADAVLYGTVFANEGRLRDESGLVTRVEGTAGLEMAGPEDIRAFAGQCAPLVAAGTIAHAPYELFFSWEWLNAEGVWQYVGEAARYTAYTLPTTPVVVRDTMQLVVVRNDQFRCRIVNQTGKVTTSLVTQPATVTVQYPAGISPVLPEGVRLVGDGTVFLTLRTTAWVQIFRLDGQRVYNKRLQGGENRISGLPAGIYIVRIGSQTVKIAL